MPHQKQIYNSKMGKSILVDETPEDMADREARQAWGQKWQWQEDARTTAIEALPARDEIEKMSKLNELREVVLKLYDVVQHLTGEG